MPIPLAQAGLAAVLSAAAPTGSNPLLAPWTGPYGGDPPVRPGQGRAVQAGPRGRHGRAAGGRRGDHGRVGPAHVREHDRGDGAFRPHAEAGPEPLRRLEHLDEQPRSSRPSSARWRLGSPRSGTGSPRTRSSSGGSPQSTRPGRSAGLTPEQKRLAWLYYTTFARTGAKLDPAGKKRLSEINQRLATLYTAFAQNVLADETDHVLFLEGERDLAGLPDSVRSAAAAAAKRAGRRASGPSSTRARAWSRS